MIAVWFVLAAAVGATARYVISAKMPGNTGTALATLYINIVGSFLLGLLTNYSDDSRTVLGVGVLGAFTTFSTFVLIATDHLDNGRSRQAATYVSATIVLCVGAAWLGLTAAEQGWT